MARLYIDNNAKTHEVTERIHISDEGTASNIVERYFIDPLTATAKLVWEYIFSFIFTSDGFGIQTKDGYIIKCKDQ